MIFQINILSTLGLLFCIGISNMIPGTTNEAKMQQSNEIYQIDGTNFTFETIGLIGIITEEEQFCWAMDLYAEENELQSISVTPKFSFTNLSQANQFKYNESFEWANASSYDKEKDDWVGSFYIYDAHSFDANVEVNKIDLKNYNVKIKGKVNLNWETAPTTNYRDFHIENVIPFNGILSEIDDKEKAFDIASKFLEVSQMKWIPAEETNAQENCWLIFK